MVSNISTICVISGDDPGKRAMALPAGNVLFHALTPTDTSQLVSLLRYIFMRETESDFGIAIDFSKGSPLVSDEWTELFCSVLLHPSCYKVNAEVVIGFLRGQHKDAEDLFLQLLKSTLHRQGFRDILIADIYDTWDNFNPATGLSYLESSILDKKDEFYNMYVSRLVDSDIRPSLFIEQDQQLIARLVWCKQNAERKLFDSEIHLASMIRSKQAKSDRISKMSHEKRQLEETLKTKNDYLDFLLEPGKEENVNGVRYSEAFKIKQFYHYEYEILPLWYKRFGHIIKVFTGKRNLGSLFNKNVKKYKE